MDVDDDDDDDGTFLITITVRISLYWLAYITSVVFFNTCQIQIQVY